MGLPREVVMAERDATILVVDDNPATLYSTSRILRAAGFDVREATTGGAALVAAADVHLIVLDVNLPDLSGFEVCRRLRAEPATARVPVIHLSAPFVKDVDKVQGYEGGADGYLTHPVEPPVLVATVQAFLRARRAEDETRRSDARFRAIFDGAPNGIALLDDALVLVEVNAAMARIVGREPGDLVGRAIGELFTDQRRVADLGATLRAHGRWRGRSAVAMPDGRAVRLAWNIVAHAAPDAYLAIVDDVTELVRLEEERAELLASERAARGEAERANRQKDDFLATVSHDLRTPLAAIVNWAQVLQRSEPLANAHVDALQAIERNAAVAVQLIADLLDVSRITSGKLHLDLQVIEAHTLLRAAVEASRSAATRKGVALRQIGEAAARWVVGDPARLQQVVWNLVSNAIKFTPRGGHVDVELRDDPGGVAILVRDDGTGIPPELLPHVFDRFRQGAASLTPHHDGLGLGLSIVRHLVEVHGGTVSAASDGNGRGSTFIVTLPATTAPPGRDAHGTPVAPSAPRRVRLDGLKVLVVDDDPEASALLERILREHGAEARTAGGTNEALSLLPAFAPSVLVSDIGMPGRDGYDLLRTVRHAGQPWSTVPAIAVTAYSGDEERRRALGVGFHVHLTKPVTAALLLASVARLGHAAAPEQAESS
jgi:PAS domain S-box-containing protein